MKSAKSVSVSPSIGPICPICPATSLSVRVSTHCLCIHLECSHLPIRLPIWEGRAGDGRVLGGWGEGAPEFSQIPSSDPKLTPSQLPNIMPVTSCVCKSVSTCIKWGVWTQRFLKCGPFLTWFFRLLSLILFSLLINNLLHLRAPFVYSLPSCPFPASLIASNKYTAHSHAGMRLLVYTVQVPGWSQSWKE